LGFLAVLTEGHPNLEWCSCRLGEAAHFVSAQIQTG
jgi:hypothetical protein